MYNTKNYTEQGGSRTVIGGEIDVTGAFKIDGGTVTIAANQAASVATDVAGMKTDFNTLLTKLKTAGLMASDG